MRTLPYSVCLLFFSLIYNITLISANTAHTLFEKANKLFVEKKIENAIELYKQSLELDPDSAVAHSNLGLAYFSLERYDEAIVQFKKVIELNKYNKKPYKYLGKTYNKINNYLQSIHYIKQALQIDPHDFDCIFLLAENLVKLNEFALAETVLKTLLDNKPNSLFVLYNTAYTLKMQGKFTEAIDYYKKTLQLNPQMDIAHLGLAKTLLALGNFKQAWNHFEYRFANMNRHKKMFNYQTLTVDDVVGKSILLRSEWGLGDMMQFIRYAKKLKAVGAKKIIVQAHNPLVQLFKYCDYIDYVIKKGDMCPPFDIQIPIMSLPRLFKTTLETIPTDIPYLYADKQLAECWKKALSHNTEYKVGICWNAKPIFLEDNPFTKRSVPLQLFAPLAEIKSVKFYSLQKMHGVDQLKILDQNFTVHTFGPDFDTKRGRFMDTAAVIQNLDLIITADTSIVHLAGAMGKQVWVLIPYVAEWRWLQERETTPWYPNNMRLFRQKKSNDWQGVIKEIKQELKKIIH